MKTLTAFLIFSLVVPSLVQAKNTLANKEKKHYDISFTSTLGVDSNPYRFSNQYSITKAQYLQQDLSAKFSLNKYWFSKLSLRDVQYQQQENWADNQKLIGELSFKKGKRKQKRFNLKYEQLDKTYVSRLSGGLSSYSGSNLNDRYNYQQLSSYWSQKITAARHLGWEYKIEYRLKDYDDFSSIGISDLDYQSLSLTNEFTHKISKALQHQASVKLTRRDYKDKRQKNLQGNDEANTELSYLDAHFNYQHLWQQTKRHKLSMSLGYLLRKDNGSGYYDSAESTLKLTSKYRLSAKTSFSAQYQYVDFAYDRPSTQTSDATTEEYSSHQQHRLKLNSKVSLNRYFPVNAQWLINFQYIDENSDKSQYAYERLIFETGLRFKF
jgi:hypothetical protein